MTQLLSDCSLGVTIRTNLHIGLGREAKNDAQCTTYTKPGFVQACTIVGLQTLSWLLVISMLCLPQLIKRLLGWGPILWFQDFPSISTESRPWGLVVLRWSHGLMGTQNCKLQAGQTGQRLICLVDLRMSQVEFNSSRHACNSDGLQIATCWFQLSYFKLTTYLHCSTCDTVTALDVKSPWIVGNLRLLAEPGFPRWRMQRRKPTTKTSASKGLNL